MVVDPWGHILVEQNEGPGVVLADIDKTQLAANRARLPALNHRRL
jgi:nitrilase